MEFPALHLPNTIGDAVEEVAVVRDDDVAALVTGNERLEPANGRDVQMVRRLVENEIVRIVDQQVRERGLRSLAAGKRTQRLRELALAEPERRQHRAQGLIAQSPLLVRGAFERGVNELLQGRFGLVGDALREITELCVLGAHDRSAEGRLDPGQEPQERRFPRPVRADQTDALAIVQNAAGARENLASAVMAFKVGKTQQLHSASRFAGAGRRSSVQDDGRVDPAVCGAHAGDVAVLGALVEVVPGAERLVEIGEGKNPHIIVSPPVSRRTMKKF